jgi:glutathione synthase/RimK-type ligase-like ATP-grasp enzyme
MMVAINGKIILSIKLAKRLGIIASDRVMIRVGSTILPAEVGIGMTQRSSYILSSDLRAALHVQKNRRMLVRYDTGENTIHLGPTIGIFASGLPNRAVYDPTGLQAELMMLSKIARAMPGQIYIFTADSVNWERSTVRGYNYSSSYSGRGYWVPGIYSLPDVVYDRIASRNDEEREKVKTTKDRLKSLPHLHYFNPSFLNKWEVHQMLSKIFELRPYLPETHLLDQADLEKMLAKYKTLFIKPANGSLGSGIIRVKANGKSRLHYTTYGARRRNGQASNALELLEKTSAFRKDRSYIVQQGVNLSTYRGSIFDLRIVYQKNSMGKWQIGKEFVRIAPGRSAIANMARGGTPTQSHKVFKHLYHQEELINEKKRLIRGLCNKIAVGIEKGSGQLYGELGLDLGLGKNGHPWLIEVNSKPRKTTETELSQAAMKNAFRRPLEYATYLAGFGRGKG